MQNMQSAQMQNMFRQKKMNRCKILYMFSFHSIHILGPCLSNPCQNGGKCLEEANYPGFRCHCLTGFPGKTCGVKTSGMYHVFDKG